MERPPGPCYAAAMRVDLESLSEAQMKSELEKYLRLFDVAHRALLRLSAPAIDAEAMRKDAMDTLVLIDRYPDHPLFAAVRQENR